MIIDGVKIGEGFDVHRLVEGRKLIIGGVQIPYIKGLEGHSDADVLLHAICDAMLGSLGLNDIGTHFPDNDPNWRGVDSSVFVRHVVGLANADGYFLGNVDTTVYAQAPKLRDFIDQIREGVSGCLGVDKRLVNIKAKTAERLGVIGRGEAIAASASILLLRRRS
jgi:2-C-methyl-D-erythritol 2,4-cyclodiphosphate synthase